MPKKGGRRRKTRTHVAERAAPEDDNTPMSFVFKMGKVPSVVSELVQDMRRVMAPYTADRLREKRKNTLKDFVSIGAPLGVTHFMFFTSTEASTNMKIARIPRGPTLSFKVVGYSLMRQVHLIHKRPVDASAAFHSSPLVVLNNFTGTEDHIKLMNVTFQNMFPAIDVQTVQLSECRRVVLFNYEKETDTVEFRQYVIRATPLGLSKSVKTIVRAKIPNLNMLEDISEYVLGNSSRVDNGGVTSDSEVDDETTHVTLPDTFRGRGNQKSEKSAVRLAEVGPRLTLQLSKVEREICEGDVLYHAYVSKTPEEAARDKAKREEAQALKRKRREEQEANVTKKKDAKDAKKQRRLDRKKAAEEEYDDGYRPTNPGDDSDMDDAEYYRQEVGEEPDAYMFPETKKQKTDKKNKKKDDKPAAPIQKFNEMAPSDKASRFRFKQNKTPKGLVVRQRQQKKK
ncbi:hypothetical protein Poli38472_000303 [Pythium oligandrum]|uniref:Brix domain-containing protein n=1 Tax=Pythium oligandrum TaxID=41045 RepID=A0A8K1CBH2_PYTOL|nr:hypothetical protein Poli38472_000303 [Pythium oligandrum]|eukprot:TMW60261.1 hypothetical protein Poli38472_000303 [Pythium oligandrum]